MKTWKNTVSGLLGLLALAGAGCASSGIKTDVAEPETWRARSVWREEKDGKPVLMAVGVNKMPRMNEATAKNLAEGDLRGVVNRFILGMDLSVLTSVSNQGVKATQEALGDDPEASGSADSYGEVINKTAASNKSVEIEIVNSEIDEDADVLRVIGMVRYEALRYALLARKDLSAAQRSVLEDDTYRTQELVNESLDRGLSANSGGH